MRGVRPMAVAPQLQRLASSHPQWPHFEPPSLHWPMTVFDVALAAGEFDEHLRAVREWSRAVRDAWAARLASVAAFVNAHL